MDHKNIIGAQISASTPTALQNEIVWVIQQLLRRDTCHNISPLSQGLSVLKKNQSVLIKAKKFLKNKKEFGDQILIDQILIQLVVLRG